MAGGSLLKPLLNPLKKPAQEVGERIFKGVAGDGATQIAPDLLRRTKLINELNDNFAPKLGPQKTRKAQRRAISAAVNNGDLTVEMGERLIKEGDDEGYEFFADAQIEKQMRNGRDAQLEGMVGDTPGSSEGPFQQINKQEAKATTVPEINTELSGVVKGGGGEEQIMSTLNTEGWQGLNDEYRFLYPEEVVHNPEILEGLAGRQDVQSQYFGELDKNLKDRTRLKGLPEGHPDLKMPSGRDKIKGVGKNIKYNDRAGKDAADLNIFTVDQDVFKVNREPLKKALEIFDLGVKGDRLEWHHTFFGNKEGGSIFLEKVTQEPMIAVNLMALLQKLDLPTSGTIGNLSLLREADHTKLHQIFRNIGLEQGGHLDFADYMKAIGDAYLKGDADVNQFFKMIEVYAEEVIPLTQSKAAQFDNLPFAQSGIADELKNYASIPDKKIRGKNKK